MQWEIDWEGVWRTESLEQSVGKTPNSYKLNRERIKPGGRKIRSVCCHGAKKVNSVIRVQNGPFDFSQTISTVTALAQALVISWLVSLIYQTWELQLPNSIGRQSGVRYKSCLFREYRLLPDSYQNMRPYLHS